MAYKNVTILNNLELYVNNINIHPFFTLSPLRNAAAAAKSLKLHNRSTTVAPAARESAMIAAKLVQTSPAGGGTIL